MLRQLRQCSLLLETVNKVEYQESEKVQLKVAQPNKSKLPNFIMKSLLECI